MSYSFDPGALLARSYGLLRGPRVCLRLARIRDLAGLEELFAAHGLTPDKLELGRLVRFDPRTQLVICATALIGAAETVVGVGAIDLDGGPDAAPDLVLVDERITEGLEQLLAQALLGRARALARAQAA